jgi:hypothetical protein
MSMMALVVSTRNRTRTTDVVLGNNSGTNEAKNIVATARDFVINNNNNNQRIPCNDDGDDCSGSFDYEDSDEMMTGGTDDDGDDKGMTSAIRSMAITRNELIACKSDEDDIDDDEDSHHDHEC